MLAVERVAIARTVRVFEAQSRCGPCLREGVAALGGRHIRAVLEPAFWRERAGPRIVKTTELPGCFQCVIPIPQLPRPGFEPETISVNVPRAWLRRLRARLGGGRFFRSVARQEIDFEGVPRNLRAERVHSGKPIVIVFHVEASVFGNDNP